MAVEFVALTDAFRDWTRTREQIRQEGAVGSLCRGIEIVALAPCGVRHGIAISDRPGQPDSWPCGFASPPQVDLYMKTDYWTGEGYRRPDFVPYQT
jgi:hypothetical protein